jgi:hypothetical protein
VWWRTVARRFMADGRSARQLDRDHDVAQAGITGRTSARRCSCAAGKGGSSSRCSR